ncbi:unannotated protein [freshwater metagenome]|uniref:Unannotated protein n=1 Tax=freshwater metagenome TaxID=449393 RepID=A0A6J7FKD6_9ZZZZ
MAIARIGLDSVHARMTVLDDDGTERPARDLLDAPASRTLSTHAVTGTAEPERGVALPYRGDVLRGEHLREQLTRWVDAGVIEPTAADKVRTVMAHPEWLALPGQTVAVLGAGAEMGALSTLLSWGATVAALDLPRPALWERLVSDAQASAGTLLVPTDEAVPDGGPGAAGADLLREVPALAEWLDAVPGRLVLGNYLYADGGTHVKVTVAADLLAERLRRRRHDLGLSFLATPTDAFAVPHAAVAHSRARRRSLVSRAVAAGSARQLLQPAYTDIAGPQICDALVPVQGPNYALAKRLQRWRAAVERADGHTVSFHVAPSTRTRSVTKNKALAAAFAGAHHFGVEIFAPETANTLMAVLLVHDLNVAAPEREHPWQDEADGAVHGGLWRTAYEPRSALNVAALLGMPSTLR